MKNNSKGLSRDSPFSIIQKHYELTVKAVF